MDPSGDLRTRVAAAVPKVRAWIDELIAAHTEQSCPAAEAGFVRLGDYFPDSVLRQVRVVKVGKIPFLPFSDLGLDEFALIAHMAATGITYQNFCFLHESMATDSTCFHEVVHALEWRALGVRYPTTYAAGLMQYGYARSPLEVIAFDMQSAFDRATPVPDILARIEAGSLEAGREADAYLRAGMTT
jgi:hypothetical protein